MGLAGLGDYAGPGGWLGFAEFLGWTALCVLAGLGVAALLGQWREDGLRRYAAVPVAVAAVVAFTYATRWVGLNAPMTAKIVFTTSLQIAGTLAAGGLVLWLAFLSWSDLRRS
jgi:hypothetical protein